jgi:hypothetical protein
LATVLTLGFGGLSCGESEQPSPRTDSITELWMTPCDITADCGDDLSCECGVCTWPCDTDGFCPAGRCRSTLAGAGLQLCANTGSPAAELCLPACTDDEDCPVVQPLVCESESCIPASAATCVVSTTATIGELTPEFQANTDCRCDLAGADCHTLYRWRVVENSGPTISLAFQKATSGGSPEPSAAIQWWLLVMDAPDCAQLDAAASIAEGVWSEGAVLAVELQASELSAMLPPDSASVTLVFVTGGGADPITRTFFTRDAIPLQLDCRTESRP